MSRHTPSAIRHLLLVSCRFFALWRFHIGPPTESRISFFFKRIGDDRSKNGREFKSVTAIACRHHKTLTIRIPINPQMSIKRIAK